ncbi:c-type cytochrome [Roseicyclus persicicus]|uniref:Cytochrome c n=1 Tax=Roseicyclus persicicus TaxID=2650661 RepID=A0A7X6JYZ9_9RHOB|nr:cytochrome c [Roseibacterium persicicum]NKX44635.1 cytochrome c [Roseibacterium persicicum]
MKLNTLLLAAVLAAPAPAVLAQDAEQIARGAYLATIMDCAGCHMPRGADGVPLFEAGLSGGTVGFEIPGMGIFWPSNLTRDPTGLGGWTDDEIATAITGGLRPDGRVLAPAMPWMSYSALPAEDLAALVAYLRSLPPVTAPRLGPVQAAEEAPAPFYRVVLPAG